MKVISKNRLQELDSFKLIAITGRMAAGKNYVCSLLEQNGWLSIDLDKLAHQAIEKASPVILETFLPYAQQAQITLQNHDGSINRRKLGELLFSNPELLKKQEEILYPFIYSMTQEFINQNPLKKIIINATVLYKIPELLCKCQALVFVDAGCIKRFIRARKRDHLPLRQIFRRFYAQRNLISEYKKFSIPLIFYKN